MSSSRLAARRAWTSSLIASAGWTASWAKAAPVSRVARSNACASRARCSSIRACSFLMTPPARSIWRPTLRFASHRSDPRYDRAHHRPAHRERHGCRSHCGAGRRSCPRRGYARGTAGGRQHLPGDLRLADGVCGERGRRRRQRRWLREWSVFLRRMRIALGRG